MQLCRSAVVLAAASLLAATACNQSNLVSAPTPTPSQPVTDTFTTSQSGGQSDILFVINNTDASMNRKAIKLGNSATGFINYLTTNDVDFHIGVTTMDVFSNSGTDPVNNSTSANVGSQAHLGGATKVLDKNTPNLLSTFQTQLIVGSNGQGDEYGIDAALMAVTNPLVNGANSGFLRPQAKLFVVWLSDEDDESLTPGETPQMGGGFGTFNAAAYATAFATAKGGAANFVVLSAIVGDATTGCGGGSGSSSDPNSDGADPGTTYLSLIAASHGLFESACSADYTTFLNSLGFQAGAPQATYFLSKTPLNPADITVKVNGAVVPASDWTYNATANSITFIPSAVPPASATVDITYTIA